MYQEISQLLMYGDIDENEILYQMGQLFARFEKGGYEKMELVRDINTQVKRILKVATDYGFDDNLWHNYLTFYLMMNENPFSMTCEKVGAGKGSVNALVEQDFALFKRLFDYDFSCIEEALEISCFSSISNYKAIQKKELMYNKNVSEKVRALSKKLEATENAREFFQVMSDFYRDYGVGMFGMNKAFRIEEKPEGGIVFKPINNMDAVVLDDLIGYEIQKKKLRLDMIQAKVSYYNNKINAYYAVVDRTQRRYAMHQMYMPMKEHLLELHRTQQWEELNELLKPYRSALWACYKKGLGLCFDKDIFEMTMEILLREGSKTYVRKLRAMVPESHWEPMVITDYKGEPIEYVG